MRKFKMVYEMSESEKKEWEKMRIESERKMWEEYNKKEEENYEWFMPGEFRTEYDFERWLDNQIELYGNNEDKKYGIDYNIPWNKRFLELLNPVCSHISC